MYVIEARNAHSALPQALAILKRKGVERDSRNGPVLVMPEPVTTVYHKPLERVVFWPERDANPFFHLYEALWMLAGRNDIAPLVRYAQNIANYSDDGVTQWGAYGHRWRHAGPAGDVDQLQIIARRLRNDPDDRRCVLSMWDVNRDLDRAGKDVPCNTVATFQRTREGALDMSVFQRSADIVWGVYGANCVHFGFLLEYMAHLVGCPVGKFTHISVNFHSYLDTFKKVEGLVGEPGVFSVPSKGPDPYAAETVKPLSLSEGSDDLDADIKRLLALADNNFSAPGFENSFKSPFFSAASTILQAHHVWKTSAAPERYLTALSILTGAPDDSDWVVAARQWVARRFETWESKMKAGAKA